MQTDPITNRTPNKEPLIPSRQSASVCMWLNLGLLPGLGTLIARRWLIGVIQLLFSLTGFAVAVITSVVFYYGLLTSDAEPPWPTQRQLLFVITGVVLFGSAWIWALCSSLAIIRQSKQASPDV